MPEVSYRDGRFWRGGEPLFVIAADYQYYRDRRERWEERLELLARGHCNTITFYVPWRHHLVGFDADGRQQLDFTGATRPNRDVVRFLELCADRGLWVIAKPGPFVHSELNIGGLPDRVSPSFPGGRDIEPVRTHAGEALRWGYDQSELPSSEDPVFDRLAREWLAAVGDALRPFRAPDGPLVAVQLNDETLYCTANAPPWEYGYDGPDLAAYRRLLEERYGTIQRYDALHGTYHASWAEVAPPRPGRKHERPEDLLAYLDWGELQWRLRRDSMLRYAQAAGLELPVLTNFAGITPPIEENVPGLEPGEDAPDVPEALRPYYSEWWLAQNRVDADRDVYHYGFISWLGVAAYDIADPRSTSVEGTGDGVLQRYLNTAGRRRGINMEENWGFAQLYHPFSKDPIVPVFQTLASIAGGGTGYVVFCGVQHDHWEDDLDRVTRRGCPTFPSDAPVRADGSTSPLYEGMSLLGRWFEREGDALLRAEPPSDLLWLIYSPYAAISGWVPEAEVGGRPTPRCGARGLESFAAAARRAGYSPGFAELDATPPQELARWSLCALRLGFLMDEACQRLLLEHVQGGGRLITCGALPEVDLQLRPCALLADACQGERTPLGDGVWLHLPGEPFEDGGFLRALPGLGVAPALEGLPDGLLATVHEGEDDEGFLFFFHLAREAREVELRWRGRTIGLQVGCKTSGVARLVGGELRSVLIKGTNEVEGITPDVGVRYGGETAAGRGDLVWFATRPPLG